MWNLDVPVTFIFRPSFLEVISRVDSEIYVQAMKHAIFCYPDGSIEVRSEDNGAKIYERACAVSASFAHQPSLAGGTYFFGSLERNRLYVIYLWDAFVRDLEDTNWVMMTSLDPRYRTPVHDSGVAAVAAVFMKRQSKEQFGEFAVFLSRHFSDEPRAGVDGKGAVLVHGLQLSVTHKVASFQINVSHAGQRSINWLVLRLLEYANRSPISEILISHEEYVRKRLPIKRSKLLTLTVPANKVSSHNQT